MILKFINVLFFYLYLCIIEDSNYAFINNSKITIFNYFNPNFCIKKEKIPFTINISYTSCSHPVKLILSPSSDIGNYY